MKRVSTFYLTICLIYFPQILLTQAPMSEETEACIDCHLSETPGIVKDWESSRHSKTTPVVAQKKSELERRISSQTIPQYFQSVVVGCYECHSQNSDKHADNFEHFDYNINVVVSPNDCRTCHQQEVEEYSKSKKAHALDNLRKNPVYDLLVNEITRVKNVSETQVFPSFLSDHNKGQTCYACHGTEIKVEGFVTVETDFDDIEVPKLTNWPNQGVGRINPDGSRGACTSCHPRHSFSIEIARKPYTCSQCHLEPDVPAYNVFKESKHGNIVFSKISDWNFSNVPWRVGIDFTAPTCATCHNSLLVNDDGDVIADRTHDFGSRLWVRIFGLPYSHPQPKTGDTWGIQNSDNLSLPTTFQGDPANSFLIDSKEQASRKGIMRQACTACHGTNWANSHFAQIDSTNINADRMVLAATKLLQHAWETGLVDMVNPFDEPLEQMWVTQWLFYANSVRYATAMSGPDYAAFKNGWFQMTSNIKSMESWIKTHSALKKKKGIFPLLKR